MRKEKINITRSSLSSSYATTYNSDITDYFMYVQHIGMTYCSPDYHILNRHIASNLICLVFKGSGTLEFDGQIYPLTKGDGFIIDCTRAHSYYPDKNDPMALQFLHYDGPMTSEFTNRIIKYQNGPIINTSSIGYLKRTIGSMYKEFKNSPKEDIYDLTNLVHDLLIYLIRDTGAQTILTQNIPSQIQSASKYIEENFTSPITSESVASMVSMSKYHFSREFKRYIGQTPYEYILFCRLNHAKYLLLNSDMPINDISTLLVFNSTSHFTDFFKKREKLTPLQYRKQYMTRT